MICQQMKIWKWEFTRNTHWMFPTTCHCGKIVMITSTSLIEKVYYQSDPKLYPVCPEWQGLAGKWYFKWKILSLWRLLWPLVQTPIDLSHWQFWSDRFFLLSFMLCNSVYFCDLPRKYHGFHELNCICRNIFSVGAEKNMEIVSIIQSLERFFSGHFDVFFAIFVIFGHLTFRLWPLGPCSNLMKSSKG